VTTQCLVPPSEPDLHQERAGGGQYCGSRSDVPCYDEIGMQFHRRLRYPQYTDKNGDAQNKPDLTDHRDDCRAGSEPGWGYLR
jgi:hypothetical protein